MATRHTITLELDNEHYQLLKTLCGPPHGNESVDEVVRDIAVGFADGVRRPGSWERGCVVQFFSREFESKLEVVEDAPFFRRPKP